MIKTKVFLPEKNENKFFYKEMFLFILYEKQLKI